MSLPLRHALENVTSPDRVLEDLLVRFIINCPPEDLSSVERELFHFEEASWFYTDFIKLMNPSLPSMKIKAFAQQIIKLCPLVWKWNVKVDQALQKFSKYKKTIPVRGAAIFNEKLTKILLVKGTESDSWSFPRGKISKDENDVDCCIREVKEEIGFDLTDYVDETQFIERNIQGKNYKIYLVSKVPENFDFKPHVRNEIEKIEWRDFKTIMKTMYKSNVKYYLVNSMMRPLSLWVRRQKQIKNEDQLKQYAEEQLKLMLGITKEEEVDPGRELLNMLQSSVHFNNSENTSEEEKQTRTNSSLDFDSIDGQQMTSPKELHRGDVGVTPVQQNYPIPPSGTKFGPQGPMVPPQFLAMMNHQQHLAPFPFVNGNFPFMPSQMPVQNINPNMQRFGGSVYPPVPGAPFPQMDIQPNMDGFSKPTLSEDQTKNTKELLNLLNTKKSVNTDSQAKPKIKILQRGENLDAVGNPVNSNEHHFALDAMKNRVSSAGDSGSYSDFEESSDDADNKSEGSLPDETGNLYEDFESSSDNGISSEESDEYSENEHEKSEQEEAELEKIGQNEEDDINTSESGVLAQNNFPPNNDIPSTIPYTESTRSVDNSFQSEVIRSSKPKIKILKRGEELDTQQNSSNVPFSADNGMKHNGTELLAMLKKPHQDENQKHLNDSNPNPAFSAGMENESKALLSMLKTGDQTNATRNENTLESSHPKSDEKSKLLLNMLKKPSEEAHDESKPGNPLLDLLRQGPHTNVSEPLETTISQHNQNANNLSTGNLPPGLNNQKSDAGEELMNMLRRNSALDTSNTNSENDFKNFSPINRDILSTPVDSANPKSSTALLDILHGRQEKSNSPHVFSPPNYDQSYNVSPFQQVATNVNTNDNADVSREFLNILGRSSTGGNSSIERSNSITNQDRPDNFATTNDQNAAASKNLLNILHKGL